MRRRLRAPYRSSRLSASAAHATAPLRRYIEVGGAVHAVSLAVGKASDATEVLQRLRAAAAASGTPELSDLGSTWTTHYLDSDGRPQLLTRSTPIKALRKTKAFRVAITDEVEVELPPESVIMDH